MRERAFWLGMFTHVGFTMFYQDMMGLEGYIEHLRRHWIDLHPLVGVVIVVVACVAAEIDRRLHG